jgi:pyruvate carboxylase subunit B
MKYFVTLGGRTLEVVVDGERVEVEGKVFEAHLSPIPGTPLRHLLLGPESYTLAWSGRIADGQPPSRRTACNGGARRKDPAHPSLTGEGAKATGASQLRAPMPGLVLRIQVQQGQAVVAGQPIVALEAMKMENELRATAAGVVQTIAVEAGQAVERGAVLVEFAAPAT